MRAAFSINAPPHLRSYMARFVPSLVRVNAFLKRIRWDRAEWEYVENESENPHINYARNPLRAFIWNVGKSVGMGSVLVAWVKKGA